VNRIAALVVSLSLLTIACGSGDPCSTRSPCANDQPLTEAQITSCRTAFNALSADCKSKVTAAQDCARAKTVCSADGKTDTTASAAGLSACSSQIQAASPCLPE
jgi:hypothetical protein